MKYFLLSVVLSVSCLMGVRGQSVDPVKFTLETNASRIQIGEEMEIVIKASLLELPSNTVFVFKENYSFKIKLVAPDGFVQTSGTYSDYIGTTLSPARPAVTYTVKGKFATSTKVNKFTLLRGNQNANDQSQFVFVTSLSYSILEKENTSRVNQENSTLVLSTPQFVKYLTIDELRNGGADSAYVVLVTNYGRVYTFRYDPNASTLVDNSGTLIVDTSANRQYVIDSDFITPEMFGAKGDGVTDDLAALQACLNVPNARYMFRKDAIYAVSNEVLIKNTDSQIIGNNATIKAFSSPGPNLPPNAFLMRTGNSTAVYSHTTTSINIKNGSAEFVFEDTAALNIGDIVRIEGGISYSNTELANQTYNYGHMSQIKSKMGNVITLTNPAIEPFTGSKIYAYHTLDRIEISNLNFDHSSSLFFGSLQLSYCTNLKIDGGRYRGNGLGQLGVLIDANINALVQRLDIDGYSNLVGSSPVGYGIGMIGHNVTAFKNRISDCKHALATSDRRYMSTGLIMDSNICYGLKVLGNTAPLDYHGNARGKAINNTIYSFNAIGAQFRDGGIDVIDNTVIINNQGTEPLTYKGLIFYEKYFGENRIEGNKVFFHHTTNPLGTFALQIDVNDSIQNKNVSVRKNFFSEGFVYWEQSSGGLVIEENEFTSPGDLGSALISPGIQIFRSFDFLIRRNTFTNRHVSLGSYAVIADSSCSRGTFRDNKINLVNNDTDPQIRVAGKETKVFDNIIMSAAATQNSYISGYTTASKALLINNKKITSNGSYVYIGYGTLPNPNAFYVDQNIVVSAGSTTTSYTCKNVGGVYSWVLTENLYFTDPATALPTKASLNAAYGAYKAGATVYFPSSPGSKRYVKLSDSSTSEWDEITPTIVGNN